MNTAAHAPEITVLRRPGWTVKLRAALMAGTLDKRLLDGESPGASPELGRRAERLLDPAQRHQTAEALRRTINAGRPRHPSSKVPVNEAEIRDAAGDLRQLVDLLDSETPANARGVVIARRLVADFASPLYSPCPPGSLADVARHARIALLNG